MEKKVKQSSRSKRDDIIAPMKTLAQSDSPISVGTLVWGKLEKYPWWPGLVVTHTDIGWPISKGKDNYCILWLGPNKTASWMPADKISDFLDQNLSTLINQLKGDDYEEAIGEALRGVMSNQKLDGNMSIQKLKSLAVQFQVQNQREEINGSKPVVMDKTSAWYKEAIKSLEVSNKSCQTITYEKMELSRPASSSNSSQKRGSIVPPLCAIKRSPSSITPEIVSNESSMLVMEQEESSPPRKKSTSSIPLPQSKQKEDGTVPEQHLREINDSNIPRTDGKASSSMGSSFGLFDPFRYPITSLPPSGFKCAEPNVHRTQPTLGNSSFSADLPAFRFSCSSYHASQSTANPTAFGSHHNSTASTTRVPSFGSQPMAPTQPTVGKSPFGPGNPFNLPIFSFPSSNYTQSSARQASNLAAAPMIFSSCNPIIQVDQTKAKDSLTRISQINHMGSIIGIFTASPSLFSNRRFFFEPLGLLGPNISLMHEPQAPLKGFGVRLTIQMWNKELRSKVLEHLRSLPSLAAYNIHEYDVSVMPYNELKLICDPLKCLLYSIRVPDGHISYSGSPESIDSFLQCDQLSTAIDWTVDFRSDPKSTLEKLELKLECRFLIWGKGTQLHTLFKIKVGNYPIESSDDVLLKHLLRRLDGCEKEVKDLKKEIWALMVKKRNV